ncbi:MAG: prepilin-type N-terminal cleavage/methylation domain-containing protein, partial [Deltaproteobacteria bacterium]|nr:prepilin-type N-terminal cleavage/methylation domain-containing protein [Deltaproteobacteria bacterium]
MKVSIRQGRILSSRKIMEPSTMRIKSNAHGFTLIEVIIVIAILIAIGLSFIAGKSTGGPPAGTTTITVGSGAGFPAGSGFRHSFTTLPSDNDIEVGTSDTFVYTWSRITGPSGALVGVEKGHVVFAVVPGNATILSINGVTVNSQGGSGHTVATGAGSLP